MNTKNLLPMLGLLPALAGGVARAETAPAAIKVGTLYASSGAYAAISMPRYDGLKLWAQRLNAGGGVFVKAFDKKIPIELIAYDDQSSTATAATLYNELITQDHVNVLVADTGSVLTSVAVPIAKEHKMLLFDMNGSGGAFFTEDNPYIVLVANPVSTIWPKALSDFLDDAGVKNGIKSVAILYCTNDFTGNQAVNLRRFLEKDGKVKIVYDQGVPNSTTSYTVLINNIAATRPDAVVELGFPDNEIAFLRNLQDSGEKFRFVFTAFAGTEMNLLVKNAGVEAVQDTYSYASPALYQYKVNYGMNLAEYHAVWNKAYPEGSGVEGGANAVWSYMTGEVIERALATATDLSQMELRRAVFALSGEFQSIAGTFVLNSEGAQIGEIPPIGQIQPNGKGGLDMVAVYPPQYANGKAVFGK